MSVILSGEGLSLTFTILHSSIKWCYIHVLCVGCRLGEMRLMAGRIRNMRQQLRDALAREGEYEQEREVHWKQYAMPLWPDVLCLQCSVQLDH